MDDIPWIYVVMIFIAFVSWVSNRIKEAAEYRRQMRAERAAAERARRTTQAPEYDSPYRQENRQREPEPEPEPEQARPQTYEDIFRELERRVSGAPAAEPVPQKTPPPLPGQSRETEVPVGAMPELPAMPLKPTPPIGVKKKRRKKSVNRGETASALTGILRDGKQLQNALILKEVLDKPVALRR